MNASPLPGVIATGRIAADPDLPSILGAPRSIRTGADQTQV